MTYKTQPHRCATRHRSFQAQAKCIWPRACWVIGDGPYALLAHCRTLSVSLHSTPEGAEQYKAIIDRSACGGACQRNHEIVELVRA